MSKPAPASASETEGLAPDYLPHVAKGAMINFSGTVIRIVLVYAYTLLLTRALDVEEVGQFFLMITLVNILGAASVAGLDFGLVRFVSLYAGEGRNRQVRRVFRVGLTLGASLAVIAAAVLFGLSGVLADALFDASGTATNGLRILAIAIPFWVMARLFNATTQGMHRMQYQVFSRDIGEQASKTLLTVLVIALGAGLMAVLWVNVASLALAALLSFFFAMKVLPGKEGTGAERRKSTRRLLKYSFPLAFSNVLAMVVLWIDLLLVGYLDTSTEAGYYGVALRVAAAGALIIVAFSTVFNPIISNLHNRRRRSELESLYKTVNRWIFTLSLPVYLILIMFSDSIMRLFGVEYVNGGTALALLALSQLVTASIGSAGLMVLMTGYSRLELMNMTSALVVDVILCLWLIPEYGIVGAAVANIAAAIVLNLLRSTEVWLYLRMHAFDHSYWKPVLAAAICSAGILLSSYKFIDKTGPAQVALLITAFMVAYLSGLLLFGLNEQDKTVLKLIWTRLTRAYSS